MTTLKPLSQTNRDTSLDTLRGFALAGVLFVFCVSDMGVAESHTKSALDEAIKWFNWIMIEGRMYGLLITIFGIGFSVQLQKAKQKDQSLVPTFLRRLTGLLLIGIIHAIFISSRDILIFYALAGIALLPARNFSNRQLLIYALAVFIFLLLYFDIVHALNIKPIRPTSWVSPNDYLGLLNHNWQFFKEYHQMYRIYPDMLFAFIVGFYVGNTGLLKKIENNKGLRRGVMVYSFILCGILAFLFYGWLWTDKGAGKMINNSITVPWLNYLFWKKLNILSQLMGFSFSAMYATALISINTTKKGKKLLQPLASFGQMALSNYLIQSFVLVPYALWFNKFNNMPPFYGTILFLVVFALQLLFSKWWLERYNFGPFEWLLRSFTYWKWQPLKKNEIIQAKKAVA